MRSGCLLLYFPELTALLHIMKNTLRTSHTHTHTPACCSSERVGQTASMAYTCMSKAVRDYAQDDEDIFRLNTSPKPAGHRRLSAVSCFEYERGDEG